MEPAILAALSAFIAAFISASVFFINAWLQRRHEFKLKRAEKYEKMAHLISDAAQWAGDVGLITGVEQPKEGNSPAAAREAQVLAALYFEKEFHEQIGCYVNLLIEYYTYLLGYLSQGPAHLSLVDRARRMSPVRFDDYHHALIKQRAAIDEKMIKLSKKYAL